MTDARPTYRAAIWMMVCALAVLAGCGSSKSRLATEQLLVSDAVDRTVAQIDFGVLSGERVYFDTSYISDIKGVGFVNSNYVISALRQQMVAAGCLLEETKDDADFIIEGRLGALGADDNEVIYGVPANNALSTAANLLPSTPAVPVIPEISIARKLDYRGAAKIGLFAYHRETRQPVWQSGVMLARSTAKDTWVMGAGPFQYGSIYKEARFAGSPIRVPLVESLNRSVAVRPAPGVPYEQTYTFDNLARMNAAAAERQAALMDRIDSLGEGTGLLPLSEYALDAPRRLGVAAPLVAERPETAATETAAEEATARPPTASSPADADPPAPAPPADPAAAPADPPAASTEASSAE